MRPASEVERRRLNDLFAELCAIPSPFGRERAMAERVAGDLRALGYEVSEDDAAAETGAECGNLFARIPGRSERSVMLCAHMDTVPHDGVVEPVLVDGGWESAGDTILGADNKAAVAMLLALAHRAAVEGSPVGVELIFSVSEENGLNGARAFDTSRLQSEMGFVFDHATPIGEVVVASPTFYRLHAAFRGAAAHAGIRPEAGRSAILAAAKAIAVMPHGRIDDETTANVGTIAGGAGGTNVVAEHCWFDAEARSLSDAAVETLVAEMVDRCNDAANDPVCECDVDVTVERVFTRLPPADRRRPAWSPPRRRCAPATTRRGASSAAAARTPTPSRPTACTASTSPTAPSATTSRASASARSPWRACST